MPVKYVYYFGNGKAEGTASMKNLLGGKGANLAEMTNLKLPVPPGFTISTEVCTYFYQNNHNYPKALENEVKKALALVEKAMGAKFGDTENPLLVSVRSGARASMPGMMDTILNLGLNDVTVEGLINKTGNARFAYDSYRRFVQMYGDVVLDLKPQSKFEHDPFEAIIEEKKKQRGISLDIEMNADDLKDLVFKFKQAIKEKKGVDFPENPWEQLWGAVGAVFSSWMNDRAIAYRKMYNIPESWGTAVNVQSMVFGNMGDTSGTGVVFTRDPATGENVFYGEYLMNAQGEDVVAGIRTPLPIKELQNENKEIYDQLLKIRSALEKHYKNMQDCEFTIQEGKLFMLQTRDGKRTGFSAIKIAVDMVDEGLISKKQAIRRIDPDSLNQLLRPIFDIKEKNNAVHDGKLLTKGLNAGPGAACGKVVFTAQDAEAWHKRGERVILVRNETSPEDIKGMEASEGILTATGGKSSHAALVARQMGKVCVAGCGALKINYYSKEMEVKGTIVREGDYISIDGTTGEVINGQINTKPSEVVQVLLEKSLNPNESPTYQQYEKLMSWADEFKKLKIRTNADQPDQAANAIAFGAEGIGLCRTEHMFFGGEKILAMREMILSDSVEDRKRALSKLLPMQRKDFDGIFRVMGGRPVTIRTLDPPLHEFVPHSEREQQDLAETIGIPVEQIKAKVGSLFEFNPMLGHRGCRLGVVYPEITEMQARAILEAACDVAKDGINVEPEIMIPLVATLKELKLQEEVVRKVAEEVFLEKGIKVKYLVGTMIELPRAAIVANEIATVAEFFSFGTNDMTQTAFGLSRDDAGKFLPYYVDHEILDKDPFQTIDFSGVGELMKMGVEKGRAVKNNLKIGICGEHGGDPLSVKFCHSINLNYVSCSPFRVPIAKMAAAKAAVAELLDKKTETKTAKKVTPKKAVAKKSSSVKKVNIKNAPAKKVLVKKTNKKK
jgi:pyruvate,orthophosphate dikinase